MLAATQTTITDDDVIKWPIHHAPSPSIPIPLGRTHIPPIILTSHHTPESVNSTPLDLSTDNATRGIFTLQLNEAPTNAPHHSLAQPAPLVIRRLARFNFAHERDNSFMGDSRAYSASANTYRTASIITRQTSSLPAPASLLHQQLQALKALKSPVTPQP